MRPEKKPVSKRINGKDYTQSAFYPGQVLVQTDRTKETFIWANKFVCRELPVFYLDLAGITYADPQYLISRAGDGSHFCDDMYVIEYVMSGKGYIEAKCGRTQVKAGDLYIVNCHMPHRYYADRDDPFEKKWLNVRGSFMTAMAPLFLRDEPYAVLPLGEEAGKIMEEIHDRIRRTAPADSDEMLGDVMKRLLDLLLLAERYRRERQSDLSQIDRIVQYIEQNICLDIHVTDLMEYFYISSSTLYRLFMTHFGMSPKNFIMYQKIEAAKRMIAEGDSTFHAIAAVLNFYDSHHFFRVFRQYTGMSPTEYKNLPAADKLNATSLPLPPKCENEPDRSVPRSP